MLKILTEWPRKLHEDSLLDLEVRSRSRGQKIAVWQEEQERLVVLFDGKMGRQWSDYVSETTLSVAPGVHLIIDPYLPSQTGASVAGVILEGADYWWSYFHQALWKGSYLEKARSFNRKKPKVDLEVFWDYYTRMIFCLCEDNEDLRLTRMFFTAYGDYVVKEGLRGAVGYIPLVVDLEQLTLIQ